MHPALRAAERELEFYLHRSGRNAAPALVDIEVHSFFHRDSQGFVAVFSDGRRENWEISTDELRRAPGFPGGDRAFSENCRSLYSRLFENHLLELDLDEASQAFQRFASQCQDPALISDLHHRLLSRQDHIRRNHRTRRDRPPVVVGWDFGRSEEITQIDLRPGAVNYVDRPPVAGRAIEAAIQTQHDHLRRQLDAGAMISSGTTVDESTTLTVEHLRAAMEMLARMPEPAPFQPVLREWQEELWRQFANASFFDVGGTEANDKAVKLLRGWLAPVQLAQYEKEKAFEVIGGSSGKRYRIEHGRQQNIYELDGRGEKVCGLCFLPEGGLAAGDVMLAQKIALETDEPRALKIANRFDDRRPRAGRPLWHRFEFMAMDGPLRL